MNGSRHKRMIGLSRKLRMPSILRSLAGILVAGTAAFAQPRLPRVVIETSLGSITAEIDSVRAPISAANFLKYVDAKAYDGGRFHRTVKPDNQPTNDVKIEVIQGGANRNPDRLRQPAIELERTSVTGLKHLDGSLSMARAGPNSATSDFFICIGAQPELDFAGKRNTDGQGFAAFGRVLSGMDIVRKIQQSPAEAQALKPEIAILSIRRS
jgi:peptidyl-prolyl cis-trans isomerase A (cyclophilin A)